MCQRWQRSQGGQISSETDMPLRLTHVTLLRVVAPECGEGHATRAATVSVPYLGGLLDHRRLVGLLLHREIDEALSAHLAAVNWGYTRQRDRVTSAPRAFAVGGLHAGAGQSLVSLTTQPSSGHSELTVSAQETSSPGHGIGREESWLRTWSCCLASSTPAPTRLLTRWPRPSCTARCMCKLNAWWRPDVLVPDSRLPFP